MKIKKSSIKKLKAKAWRAFSLYIRRRGAKNGLNYCVTCGDIKHFKELHAGHFIPGRHPSILFDERNCHPQCYRCNIHLKSNPIRYREFMEKTYGVGVIQELDRLDHELKQFTPNELIEIKLDFENKLKELQ